MAKKTRAVSPKKDIPVIVGVGTSTGGFNSLRKFLGNMGEPQNIAVVILQHLAEAAAPWVHETLSEQTSMKVVEISDGLKLKKGVVFYGLSHDIITISNGAFQVEKGQKKDAQVSAIDQLFRSMAKDQGQKAVGVILSGDGTDGAQGLKAISEAGGMTLAQVPETSEFPSMPQNAVGSGSVDHVLPAEEIPKEVLTYADYLEKLMADESVETIHEEITAALVEICEILNKTTQHDFKHYKTSTLVRRIQRRMQVLQLTNVENYVDQLQKDSKEADALFKELLINVTCFFRDPEAFSHLKEEVLLKALKNRKTDQKYRIWVAGCSTGEEVYTLAILVREILEELPEPPEVQIIATDIDEIALNLARKGSYPVTIAEHVSAARLKKFFVRKGGRYVVSKELREIVLFSSHNLINDPPFSQLDLISCRNVLIYLGPHLQKKLIPVFHYALRPGGCLFLGTSESLTGHKELFRTLSSKFRIAQRKATAIVPPGWTATISHAYVSHQTESTRNHEADVHLVSQRIVLDEFAPKYAVVNDECQIVSVSGGIAQYFDPSEGSFQNNLMKLVKPSLRVALRTTFNEAKKQKRKVTHQSSTLKMENETARIGITVQPMPHLGEESGLAMVVFHYYGPIQSKETLKDSEAAYANTEVVEQLERELSTLREDLDRTVQDLEASNEELKSSNEELLSMNEELQSANEELESSKEEVQNANEALQRSNNDLENLLSSTEIATLFLDEELKIHSFTPQLESIYNIQSVDIGRPISHLTTLAKIMPPFPNLKNLPRESRLIEDDIQMQDGRWILRRISPYRTTEGNYSGIVVTFIDVSHLRDAEERYRQLANSMPQIVWTAGPNGEVDYFNERWYEYTGAPRGVVAQSWEPILHPDDLKRSIETRNNAIRQGLPYEIEYRLKNHADGKFRWFLGRAIPIKDASGAVSKWYGSAVDINDRVLAEELRRESEKRFQIMADSAPVLVWIAGADKLRTWFNKGWLEWTGRTIEQELGNGWQRGVHPEDLERCLKIYNENFEAHRHFSLEYRLLHHSGEYRWVSGRGVPRFTPDGNFEGFIGGCMDIHEQKMVAKQVDYVLESMHDSFLILDKNWRFTSVNHNFELMTQKTKAELTGKNLWEAFPGSDDPNITYKKYYTKVMEERVPVYFTDYYAPLNLWTEQRVYPGLDGGIAAFVRDVGEEKRAAQAIADKEHQFQVLADSIPQLAWMADPEGNIYWYNRRWYDYTGATFNEVKDWGWEKFHRPEGLAKVLPKWKQSLETGEAWEDTFEIRSRSGEFRWFLSRALPIRDKNNKISAWFGTNTDITEQLNQETQLRRAKEEAESANESKTRFLANMSHEIRTPLAAILGFSELLQGRTQADDPDANLQLNRIARNAAQLGKLIDELLDLSKIEAERLEVERTDFNLLTALEESFSTVGLMARQKGLIFEQHSVGPVPKFINADPMRFKQILTNIIGNAVKFTEAGRIDVSIELIKRDGKDFLQVRVKDTGIGLSPEQQVKIFEPFMQADASVTRKYGGTGLGLGLSRRLAHLMGGDLILEESNLGRGSSFLITIEIGIVSAQGEIDATANEVTSSPQNKKALEGKTILVVDDSPDNQTIIRLFIHAVGGKIEIANNGLEAVQKMKNKNYDVVLMDIQMPVMDGYQALKVANESGYRGPIVALTAHAMKEERDRCMAAGFTSYLSKPIDRNLLIQRLFELTR